MKRTNPLTPSEHEAADTAPLSELSSDLRLATFRLARRLRAEKADSMSDGAYAVLASLSNHGCHTLGELAARERVSAPSMNRTVNCLEESGYVSRTADPGDRRKVKIDLTEQGRSFVEATVRRRTEWLERVLHALPEQDVELLRRASALLEEIATR